VPGGDKFSDRRRSQPDTIFVVLDFLGDSDAHTRLLSWLFIRYRNAWSRCPLRSRACCGSMGAVLVARRYRLGASRRDSMTEHELPRVEKFRQ